MSQSEMVPVSSSHPPAHILQSIHPRRLELIILPTEKCNLRCTYCYEDFAIGRIRPDVLKGIKTLISRRAADLHLLELSWFGGEPLLASDTVLEICNHANELAKQYPNLQVTSSMTTNGVLLTPELAEKLDTAGVKQYQISLDGPQPLHDQTRVTVKGGGTYTSIWKNLVALARTNLQFRIFLRVHYQLATWRDVLPLIDSIKNEIGVDDRFQVIFKPIVALGGKNDKAIASLNSRQKAEIQNELQSYLKNEKASKIDDTQIETVSTERIGASVCYAAQANSLVIRANGRVNKCTVALSDERNDIGSLNPDGTLTIDRDKLTPWLKGLETQGGFELSCPYASHIRTAQQSDKPKISMSVS